MRSSYEKVRSYLIRAELWPRGRMAHLACYMAGLAALLFLVEKGLGLISAPWGQYLGGWIGFLIFCAAILFFILGFRWVKRRILWRLRNRLIVTYVFIGVIPAVLLVAMGLITLYGLGGQFAVFVVTSEIHTQLRSLEAVNTTVTNELAAHLERGEQPQAESLVGLRKRDSEWSRRHVCAWYSGKPLPVCNEIQGTSLTVPGFVKGKFRDIVRDGDKLYLRVASSVPVGGSDLIVVTSEPFDKELVGKIAENLGEITLYTTGISTDEATPKQGQDAAQAAVSYSAKQKTKGGDIVIESNKGKGVLGPDFRVGKLPQSTDIFDPEITFGAPLGVVDWLNGEKQYIGAALQVTTRPAVLYTHLFAALGEFVRGVAYFLVGVGILFAIIELVALIIGTRMTRTVTAAVAQLHEATRHVDRGDFSHRIPVKSKDQLADLALSFNSMTASIEKLILEQKEKQRLENELSIAQEVQAQLFPRQVSELESLEVHGFCRPARTVSGDYYDFLTASSHKLILAVGDISGKGISAALLMATIHSAVRAYSVENLPQMREPVAVGAVAGSGRVMATWPEGVEVSPGALLGLLNHQLYESTPPEKYATLFLGIYDGRTHQLTYSNGGHLPPILIGKDGAVRRLEAGGTVVGLFDNMTYQEASVQMHAGEVFIAYSDGVTEPENEFGEFGEQRLIEIVRDNRDRSLPEISQLVTTAVDNWIGDREQPDDVTLVLARAR
jgi:sigma-B regulation protein RsbU (phosphoserine phosphatase)